MHTLMLFQKSAAYKKLDMGFRILGGGRKLFAGSPCPQSVKTDKIAKLRIKLKRILLEIPLNKIKGTCIKFGTFVI